MRSVLCLILQVSAFRPLLAADTHYVNIASTNATPPYTNWATAATVIQDAVDAATNGDTVLAMDGLYELGATAVCSTSNRVALTKPITLRSVNGPEATVIRGQGPLGNTAIRCAYVTNGAMLAGFTLTNGFTKTSGDWTKERGGGGAFCEGSGTVSNCIVVGNQAHFRGGGCAQGALVNCIVAGNQSFGTGGGLSGSGATACTLSDNVAVSAGGGCEGGTAINCAIFGNQAGSGGGASGTTLRNCTVIDNHAYIIAGGVHNGYVYNSIVYYNSAVTGTDNCFFTGQAVGRICTTPAYDTKTVTNEPGLAGPRNYHLLPGSPCIDTGILAEAQTNTLDPDGDSRVIGAGVDLGCDEYVAGTQTGALRVAISPLGNTNSIPNTIMAGGALRYQADIEGRCGGFAWTWGDGTTKTNAMLASHVWPAVGTYEVTLEAWNLDSSAATSLWVQVLDPVTNYVSPGGSNVYPYTSWETAARSLQAAITAAPNCPGALVLVADGVYSSGVTAVNGMNHRVALTRPVTVRATNTAPWATVIRGSGGTNTGTRCAFVAEGAVLAGFTLTDGSTSGGGDPIKMRSGGAAWCDADGVVSNCYITHSVASEFGGAVYGGTIVGSVLLGNVSLTDAGAAYQSSLYDCTVMSNVVSGAGRSGGGLHRCRAERCRIVANRAGRGGGAAASTLTDCFIGFNSAADRGGGVYLSSAEERLNRCYVVSNSAAFGGGVYADGGSGGRFCDNTFIHGNTASQRGGGFCGNPQPGALLRNCTVAGNSAMESGGVDTGQPWNSIVYYNDATINANYGTALFSYSCTDPLPGGAGNTTNPPGLLTVFQPGLASNSPCLNLVSNLYVPDLYDIDGDPRTLGPKTDLGCDEFDPAGATGRLDVALSVDYTNAVFGTPLAFEALITGRALASRWDWGDGTASSNLARAAHAFPAAGDYSVVLRAWNLDGTAAATVTVTSLSGFTNYVAPGGTPLPPFTTPATAAAVIQDAIAAAVVGGTVVVAPGVYGTGLHTGTVGRSRIGIWKPLHVVAADPSPWATVIAGAPGTTATAVRCAYVGPRVTLSGFTLTGGEANGGDVLPRNGGGALCDGQGVLSGCTIVGNQATNFGGGVFGGAVIDCTIQSNRAPIGGGAAYANLQRCWIESNVAQAGGGVRDGLLSACLVVSNTATVGAGVQFATAQSCLLAWNMASQEGGGASESTLQACTVVSNTAANRGGGVRNGTIQSSIVWGNACTNGSNFNGGTFSYSCTYPSAGGTGNRTNDPLFVAPEAGDFRLRTQSPCLDRGGNASWMTGAADLEGNARILNGAVDMGAYELPFTLALRAMLQGAFRADAHAMQPLPAAVRPTAPPYAAARPFGDAAPTGIVDWVQLEVAATIGATRFAQSLWLAPDGTLLDALGRPAVAVSVTPQTPVQVTVRHRNHLAATSAQTLVFTNRVMSYDFTTGAGRYLGGTNACVELEPGVWGLIAGDADGDGRITPTDRAIVTQQMGKTGYLSGDLNLDGIVNGADAP